ncbi:hypothetical protein ACO0K9_13360 [Undibacterium sp. Ji50W]|uniref:hypothetical protein n=1 Tax=Undibacterium sp. Ji50W TaxID=3413041 RepID=UPI003BF40851
MQYSQDDLTFSARWSNRPFTGRQYIDWVIGCLKNLALVNDALTSLYILSDVPEGGILISAKDARLESLIISSLDHSRTYIASAGEKFVPGSDRNKFTLDSRCGLGFHTGFCTTLEPEVPGITILMNAGRALPNLSDHLTIIFSKDSEFVQDAKKIFLSMTEYIKPNDATIWRTSVSPYPKQPIGDRKVGWLTYFDDKGIVELLPNDIRTEFVANGVIVQASDYPPSPGDKVQINSILQIFNALKPHGVLNKQ